MIIVCIGIGDGWSECAHSAASRMSEMTGLDYVVIDDQFADSPHPSWLKAKVTERLPDYDDFLVMDADMVCVQTWNPLWLYESMGRPFCAVPDTRDPWVYGECMNLGIPFPDTYVNGGLTMFNRRHQHVWDKVWARLPSCGQWQEQGALNLALLETGVEVCRLPRRFNVILNKGCIITEESKPLLSNAVNIHGCNIGGVEKLKQFQERYGLLPEAYQPVTA